MGKKYSYSYERTSDYCYPNSDVLINKLNIKIDSDLFVAEREFVMFRAAILIDNPLKGNFDFDYLKSIHKYLFQDVYLWAGKSRTCNIAKTNLFCLAMYIDTYALDVFNKIVENNYYIDLEYKDKVFELTNLFADINALHPFREGNGRTQREFINAVAKVNEEEMIIASSESTNGDMKKIETMFKKIVTTISKEEQLKAINDYIQSDELRIMFLNKINN